MIESLLRIDVVLFVLIGVLGLFGPVGRLIDIVLTVNLVLVALLLAISVPLYMFARDIRKTLERFGLLYPADARDDDPVEKYVDRARTVFHENPAVAVYVYGHTHRPAVTDVDGRLVVNTGTWLKRLRRVEAPLGIVPPVYYSSYQLNYFRISEAENGGVRVGYDVIDKPDPNEETMLQRLLTRAPTRRSVLPAETVVDPTVERDGRSGEIDSAESAASR